MNIALFIYRRPEHTKKVLDSIRLIKPKRLFIVADGPTGELKEENRLIAETRMVTEGIDWPCEVFRVYSETNLGCRKRISSGLKFVFEQVDRVTILEDDCLPSRSFFQFSSELLEKYKNQEKVLSIGGSIWPLLRTQSSYSYWFSNYPTSWGWSTWRRGWEAYEEAENQWSKLIHSDWLENRFGGRGIQAQFWRHQIGEEFDTNSTWDYTWNLAHWLKNALAIRPSINLVRNIGFDQSASRTKDKLHPAAGRFEEDFTEPLKHPEKIETNSQVDDWIEKVDHSGRIERRLRLLNSITKNTLN